VFLHGGPGVPHDYLEPLEGLAEKRPLVFYDQVGCGRSPVSPDVSVQWSMNLFLDELEALVKELRLDRFHLYGHSWGGMMALEYVLGGHDVCSMILVGTIANREKCMRYLAPMQAAAGDRYYELHQCRVQPLPECLQRARRGVGRHVNEVMAGDSSGLRGVIGRWDVTARLAEIDMPTLILSGRHDSAAPEVVADLHRGIRSARWVILEESSHHPQLEEPEAFLYEVDRFLKDVEIGLGDHTR
jgi:L-proline amide hydrolase